MSIDMIVSALSLAKQIHDMAQTAMENVERTKELGARVMTLQQPLETLQTQCKNPQVYESALKKLIPVLEQCQEMVRKQSKKGAKSGVKKFFLGDEIVAEFAELNAKLDSSLLDLQVTISAAEVGASEEKIAASAKATADEIAESAARREREPLLKCVQCNEEFRESTNGDGQCKFHPEPYQGGGGGNWHYPCCKATEGWIDGRRSKPEDVIPCLRLRHRANHHYDYPYENFFVWATDQYRASSKWLVATDADFEDLRPKEGCFGHNTSGTFGFFYFHGNKTIFGQIFPVESIRQYRIYPAPEDGLVLVRDLTKKVEEKEWWIRGYWIINLFSGLVEGAQLSVKSLSSTRPIIKQIFFTASPPKMIEIKDLTIAEESESDDEDLALPHEETVIGYQFPQYIFEEKKLSPEEPSSGDLPIFFRRVGPCLANVDRNNFEADIFYNEFYVQNITHKGGHATNENLAEEKQVLIKLLEEKKISSDEFIKLYDALKIKESSAVEPVTIVDIRTELYINEQWVPSSAETLLGQEYPLVIQPYTVSKIKVSSYWPCENKKKANMGSRRSYVARINPVKFRLIFESIEGKESVVYVNYANSPATSFDAKKEDDLYYLFCDNEQTFSRLFVRATLKSDKLLFSCKSSSLGREANIGMIELENIIYQALKNVDGPKVEKITDRIILYELNWFELEKAAYAFIDLKRRKVVGFRFRLCNDGIVSSGRWLVDVRSLINPTKKSPQSQVEESCAPAKSLPDQDTPATVSVAVPVVQSQPVATAPPPSSTAGSASKATVRHAYYCKPCSMNVTIGGRCARCPQMKSQTPAQYCTSCVPFAGTPMNCVKCSKSLGPIAPGKSYPQDQAAHLCGICGMGPKKSMCIKCQKLII